MAGFSVISLKLKEMYQMLTLGGDAELELVDSLDPFAEGIVFSVRPPKKSWKNISNLSGEHRSRCVCCCPNATSARMREASAAPSPPAWPALQVARRRCR